MKARDDNQIQLEETIAQLAARRDRRLAEAQADYEQGVTTAVAYYRQPAWYGTLFDVVFPMRSGSTDWSGAFHQMREDEQALLRPRLISP